MESQSGPTPDQEPPIGETWEDEDVVQAADSPDDVRLRDIVWFPAMVCCLALVCAMFATAIVLLVE